MPRGRLSGSQRFRYPGPRWWHDEKVTDPQQPSVLSSALRACSALLIFGAVVLLLGAAARFWMSFGADSDDMAAKGRKLLVWVAVLALSGLLCGALGRRAKR